jgi:protein-L-isoaspartate(D-aspartate) O-methyltransferase
MFAVDPAALPSLPPLARWLLRAILSTRPLPGELWLRLCQGLPLWPGSTESPAVVMQRLQREGWIADDADGRLAVTGPAGAIADAITSAAEPELRRWNQLMWRAALIHASPPARRILSRALSSIDRGACVPPTDRAISACDVAFELTHARAEPSASVVVRTLAAARPRIAERVLVCGGRGGSIALGAAGMIGPSGRVLTIDWDVQAVEQARAAVAAHGQSGRVQVAQQDDVTLGRSERGPWDVIVLFGAVPRVPENLLEQLNGDTGRVLFFLHDGRHGPTCWVVRKHRSARRIPELEAMPCHPIPGRGGFDPPLAPMPRSTEGPSLTMVARRASAERRLPRRLGDALEFAHTAEDPAEQLALALALGRAMTNLLARALDVRASRPRPGPGSAPDGAAFRGGEGPPERPRADTAEDALSRPWNDRSVLAAHAALALARGAEPLDGNGAATLRDVLAAMQAYDAARTRDLVQAPSDDDARALAATILRALRVLLTEEPFFSSHLRPGPRPADHVPGWITPRGLPSRDVPHDLLEQLNAAIPHTLPQTLLALYERRHERRRGVPVESHRVDLSDPLPPDAGHAKMIAYLRAQKVCGPAVLAAMDALRRRDFVPTAHRRDADQLFRIDDGRVIPTPEDVARALERLAVKPGDRVLEIGGGCGYVTAVLLRMGAHVTTIEPDPAAAARCIDRLEHHGLAADVHARDGAHGWPERGPFDRILAHGATAGDLAPLVAQLTPGGILLATMDPDGPSPLQSLIEVRRGPNGDASLRLG